MPDTEAFDFRAALEDERRRLREGLVDAGSEGLQPAAWRGEGKARGRQLLDELDEIERALAKFEDNSYGICEKCARAIAPERLEAKPATRFCVDCAR